MKWIASIGVILLIGMLAVVAMTMRDVNGKLDVIAALPQKANQMSEPMVTKWNSATGEQILTTVQMAGESNTAFAQRHKARVVAMQVEFPKIP